MLTPFHEGEDPNVPPCPRCPMVLSGDGGGGKQPAQQQAVQTCQVRQNGLSWIGLDRLIRVLYYKRLGSRPVTNTTTKHPTPPHATFNATHSRAAPSARGCTRSRPTSSSSPTSTSRSVVPLVVVGSFFGLRRTESLGTLNSIVVPLFVVGCGMYKRPWRQATAGPQGGLATRRVLTHHRHQHPKTKQDFEKAAKRTKPSVAVEELQHFTEWTNEFGQEG